MYSLYYAVTHQHAEEFAPVRCNEQTLMRLVRYFEDIVTENKLSALILEGRFLDGHLSRETERISRILESSRALYLFSCEKDCHERSFSTEHFSNLTLIEEDFYHDFETGPFIVVMDPRFSGLMASYALPSEDETHPKVYEMVWTFDPNVAFTAIEYLMGRICAQRSSERPRFEECLNASTPHGVSLRLALTLTTKLTMLMQRQNELEMATNRISSAISSSLEIESILQSAVDEVGRALKARKVALVLWEEETSKPESISVYERADTNGNEEDEFQNEGMEKLSSEASVFSQGPGPLEIPITYRSSVIGVLMVEDDTPGRLWEDEEELMAKTVADELAVAISHARLFKRVQIQAMTDALTGLYNHRYFQERLEREIKLADRNDTHLSLIMLDLDHLKRINDTYGHRKGDAALTHVARMMRSSFRDIDICARYGGEEFVAILPQCGREDALKAAERLREAIASTPVRQIGQVTASIGVATYPESAVSQEELIEMADRAMYVAKESGRNRVRSLMTKQPEAAAKRKELRDV
ncbi:MAG: sensor domain-containing diguanylate cyclase [Acidobacteriota bacterium]